MRNETPNNTPARSKAQVNRAIRHTGLEIQGQRGGGYFYFTETASGDQAGESIMVCHLHHQTVGGWVEDAESALVALKIEQAESAEYRLRVPPGTVIRLGYGLETCEVYAARS
jgi:hypothetical protein